jgi:phytanoyl-CoA hydroxylase
MTQSEMLTPEACKANFFEQGYAILRGFVAEDILLEMEARILGLCDELDAGHSMGDAMPVFEKSLADQTRARDKLSKLFRLHRDQPVFNEFCCADVLKPYLEALLGKNYDCFLSQFIFKYPGALGQPWHQDKFYFNFDRSPQIGLWLAVTEATKKNGPLWILPGSHKEPVHEVISDDRKNANPFYVEIVDHDMSDAICVTMAPGDLLFFHSHLMHKSTDNHSDTKRAAMVYHYADSATVDLNLRDRGQSAPNMDWLAVSRNKID